MNALKFLGFNYEGLNNGGDYIQSIAVERLLPAVLKRFNRDTIGLSDSSEKAYVIMNGWFSHHPETCLPKSSTIIPLFWGFHISYINDGWNYFLQDDVISYLKKHEPIGCRDPYTAFKLGMAGVKTFVSRCLTLTLPKRKVTPADGLIVIVDGNRISQPNNLDDDRIVLPEFIKQKALFCTHQISSHIPENAKMIYAKHLLLIYRKYAKLVITSRLHCLLPCIAMGIPVIFFGDKNDYRVSWVEELGVNIYSPSDIDRIDWNPLPIDFEERRRKMISEFKIFLHHKIQES